VVWQPRSQGFSLEGRRGGKERKGKALGTRLVVWATEILF